MTRPDGVRVKLVANPVRLSETPADYRIAPPTLGQHTDEVLTAHGITNLDDLRARGVI
jgi:crotonobetainyl-CoA:carnitine CoA-transferase CaiB-like acyl-CoA transferase